MKTSVGGREYEIRGYRDDDEPAVLELHRRVFGEAGEASRRAREWRFRSNPAGRHRTSVCVDPEGRVVCAYTGIPLAGRLLGRPATFALIVDTMSHPDVRGAVLGRRGLLVLTALEWAGRNFDTGDIGLCFGVPEERNARLGTLTLGYRSWDRIRRYGRTLRDSPRKRVRRMIGNRRVREVAGFGEEADELWARASSAYETAVVRDARHLSWRYGRPEGGYTVLVAEDGGGWGGWLVLARREGACIVADAIVPGDPKLAKALVVAAVDRALGWGLGYIQGWATPGGPLAAALEAAGFRPAPLEGTDFTFRASADLDQEAISDGLYMQPGDTDEI